MKDFYATYKEKHLWFIKEEGFDEDLQGIRESQFSIGNGFMGMRGVLEEKPKGAFPGTYVAGIYDRITSKVAELVNFPNPFYFKFSLKGEKVGAVSMDVVEHERFLNMYDGVVVRHTIYSDVKKRQYDYQSIRFVSMHDKNIGCMQIILTPLDSDADIAIQTGMDIAVHNIGTITEGDKRHFNVKELTSDNGMHTLVVETLEKRYAALYHYGFHYKVGRKKTYSKDTVLRLKIKKNKPAVFTQFFSLVVADNQKMDRKQIQTKARRSFQKYFRGNFEKHIKAHSDVWHTLWDTADVIVEGTASLQKNLRFNIYHMLICGHADNGFSSIGARTMSGEGYHGHVFWDAEIFMLPFYAYVMPEVARNMLQYRYNRLDQARQIAKEQGYKGVMFPWESAGIGVDETPTWAKNLDGSIIRIKTNKLEHHITSDIAYACCLYAHVTDDVDFMRAYGYEMIFAGARFWASRLKRNRRGRYEIRDVIGPDEFHEHVNNNAYTNVMAKWNLLEGYKLYHHIKKLKPETYKKLRAKLNVSDKEVHTWKDIAFKIVFKQRRDKVIEEFDGYFKKRFVHLKEFDENGIPLLPKGIKVKDYQKTQLVKQADVVMLLYLLRNQFNQKDVESNYHFYVKRTLHKSSLSAPIYAIMALEAGDIAHAYQFFNVGLRADISNLHGNSHQGIHAASLGGVWQSVIHGFAGIRRTKDLISIHPRMPKTWRNIKCSLLWKKDCLRITVNNDEVRIIIESKKKKKIQLRIFEKKCILRTNEDYIFHKKHMYRRQGYY